MVEVDAIVGCRREVHVELAGRTLGHLDGDTVGGGASTTRQGAGRDDGRDLRVTRRAVHRAHPGGDSHHRIGVGLTDGQPCGVGTRRLVPEGIGEAHRDGVAAVVGSPRRPVVVTLRLPVVPAVPGGLLAVVVETYVVSSTERLDDAFFVLRVGDDHVPVLAPSALAAARHRVGVVGSCLRDRAVDVVRVDVDHEAVVIGMCP